MPIYNSETILSKQTISQLQLTTITEHDQLTEVTKDIEVHEILKQMLDVLNIMKLQNDEIIGETF